MKLISAVDGLAKTGILHAARFLTRRSPRILMYHRFAASEGEKKHDLLRFEKQLLHMQKNFSLMTVSELVSRLRSGVLSPGSAAITVDDCYADFYKLAWPIVRRYGIPVTVYAVSDFVSRRTWLWPDVIRYIVNRALPDHREFTHQTQTFALSMGDSRTRCATWEALADYCLLIGNDDRKAMIKSLAAFLGVAVPETPPEEYEAMTWDQLAEICREGSEVGSHTISHPRLTALSLEEARWEILGSKLQIEQQLGVPVKSFCYPNGTSRDYDDQIKAIVRDCGYENATIAVPKSDVKFDPYELGRIGAEIDMWRFKRSVSGLSQLVGAVRGR